MRKKAKGTENVRRGMMAAAVVALAIGVASPSAWAAEPADITTAGGIPLPMSIGDGDTSKKNETPTIAPPSGVDPIGMAGGIAPPADSEDDPLAWSDEGGDTAPAPAPVAVPADPAPVAIQQPDTFEDPLAFGEPEEPAGAMVDHSPSPQPAPAIPSPAPVKAEKQPAAQPSPAVQQLETPHAAPAAAVDDGAIGALDARIAKLEEKLGALDSAYATKADVKALKDDVAALRKEMSAHPAPAKAEKKSAKKPEVSSEKKSASPAKSTASKKSKPAPKWVLKSAKPGMAWIAEADSGEMRTISVGEKLSGVGKVVSIAPDASGKWMVTGTQGKISQTP